MRNNDRFEGNLIFIGNNQLTKASRKKREKKLIIDQ